MVRGMMRPVVLILGPTASGKTALALALAKTLDGEIVNADSMQVYRDLRILTARPTPEEEAQSPHHLFGTVDGAQRFSVGQWQRAAVPVVEAIRARGRTAILVGGTGLYFKALTEGLAAIPEPPEALTAALRAKLSALGPQALHGMLALEDPAAAARLSAADGVRIVRALAVKAATGQSILAFQEARALPSLAAGEWVGVALTPPRGALYAAIDQRFEAMMRQGALEEVRALVGRGLDPTLPLMKAHGVPWLQASLRQEMALETATSLGKRDTRHYAKRQFTWIAHQADGFLPLPATDLSQRVDFVCDALERLKNAPPGR